MTWQGTKTDWTPDDGVDNKNFNRIEGNVQDNHVRLGDIEDGATKVSKAENTDKIENGRIGKVSPGEIALLSDEGAVFTPGTSTFEKRFECQVGLEGRIRVYFELESEDATTRGKIYVNGNPVGQTRTVSGTTKKVFSEDVDVKEGDYLQVYCTGSGSINRQNILRNVKVKISGRTDVIAYYKYSKEF